MSLDQRKESFREWFEWGKAIKGNQCVTSAEITADSRQLLLETGLNWPKLLHASGYQETGSSRYEAVEPGMAVTIDRSYREFFRPCF